MKQFSILLSFVAVALPAVVNADLTINGWTEPNAEGAGANKLITGGERCINFDDPNIVGAGDAVNVFHNLKSTISEGHVPVDAWLYRGRDCHDDAPMYVDDSEGWKNIDPPASFESCRLMERGL